MLPNLRQQAPRVVTFLAAVLVAVLAFHELSATRRYAAYLSLEGMFRGRQPVAQQAVKHYAESLDGDFIPCRSDIVDAVVSVSQRHLDDEFNARNRPGWLAAMQRMEGTLRNALACRPTNGDLWVRLATIRWFLGASANEQLSFMTLSQAYSPANLATIKKRLRYWSQVTPSMALLGEDLLRADIRTILLHAPEKEAVSTLAALPERFLPLTRSEQAVVSQPRLKDLAEAGLPALR